MSHPNKSYFIDNAHKYKEDKPAKKSKKKEEPKVMELPNVKAVSSNVGDLLKRKVSFM
tara:strand:+ start:1762 stop:1935 length:174 start_codon:yes stop_codon:yes gene_type:complete